MNKRNDKLNRTPKCPASEPKRLDEQENHIDTLDWDLMSEEQQQDILDHLRDMPFQ
ncbi:MULTISPECIES: hypothetical protein [Vibrio]|uniref:hypothetical protein n=1 Tax=Vibrio TaxID=662 RepID=UPI00142E9250|nr:MULTISPECIES: hypothetical protein [Vibrio]